MADATKGHSMSALRALLDPKAIAVVGASPRPGPGSRVIANLRDAGFKGDIFAVNPRYRWRTAIALPGGYRQPGAIAIRQSERDARSSSRRVYVRRSSCRLHLCRHRRE